MINLLFRTFFSLLFLANLCFVFGAGLSAINELIKEYKQ